MRQLFYDPRKDKDLINTYKDLEKETDRGAAIVFNAYIEDLLREILKRRLIFDGKKDEIIKSIDNRLTVDEVIKLCYATGTISKKQRDELASINRIRNKFAHRKDIKSFEHSEIKKLCKDLRCLGSEEGLCTRQTYDVVVVYYLQFLKLMLIQTEKIKPAEEKRRVLAGFVTILRPYWEEKKQIF